MSFKKLPPQRSGGPTSGVLLSVKPCCCIKSRSFDSTKTSSSSSSLLDAASVGAAALRPEDGPKNFAASGLEGIMAPTHTRGSSSDHERGTRAHVDTTLVQTGASKHAKRTRRAGTTTGTPLLRPTKQQLAFACSKRTFCADQSPNAVR